MSTSRRSLLASSKRGSSTGTTIEMSTISEPSLVSTSAHSIRSSASTADHPASESARPASPPASSYFPTCADQYGEPQPTPDATSHFAYSTTLRRHRTESIDLVPHKLSDIAPAQGLLQKAIGLVTGQRYRDDTPENGYTQTGIREERRDTPSARFAHWSVEVCFIFLFYVLPTWPCGSAEFLHRNQGATQPRFLEFSSTPLSPYLEGPSNPLSARRTP